MREVLADAAAQRKRHRRRCGDGRGADFVGDIGFETVHQLDGGRSAIRLTFISKEKRTSLGSTEPLIGAAERKCGVAATGR